MTAPMRPEWAPHQPQSRFANALRIGTGLINLVAGIEVAHLAIENRSTPLLVGALAMELLAQYSLTEPPKEPAPRGLLSRGQVYFGEV
jgi:hypothetical protein